MTVTEVAFTQRLLASGEARRLRERSGFSIDDVVREMPPGTAVDRSMVSRWERGMARPRRHHAEGYAVALARVLDVVAYLDRVIPQR